MSSYQWNAVDYARSSAAQQQWARELIRKLELRGDETVLDIGCGDGKVTAEIAAAVPKGSVVGIDNSDGMIALARSRYPAEAFPNLHFRLEDARRLHFRNEFDVMFSNATLHWIPDQPPVLRGIFDGLKRNGKVLLQMGGRGNAADVLAAFEEMMDAGGWRKYFAGFDFSYGFFGPDEYAGWLGEAGLESQRVELFPKDMTYNDKAGFEGWIRTTWLPHTQRVPEEKRNGFISQVADAYLHRHPADDNGIIHVAMMRLEVEAFKH
jgi:trans-aconitate 2-methyltransferase